MNACVCGFHRLRTLLVPLLRADEMDVAADVGDGANIGDDIADSDTVKSLVKRKKERRRIKVFSAKDGVSECQCVCVLVLRQCVVERGKGLTKGIT